MSIAGLIQAIQENNFSDFHQHLAHLHPKDMENVADLINILCFAAAKGNVAMICVLLAMDEVIAIAAAQDNQALCSAVENNHLKVVQALLQIKAVKAQAHLLENYILHCAVEDESIEIVKELLTIDAVARTANVKSNKILWKAIEKRNTDVTGVLLAVPAIKSLFVAQLSHQVEQTIKDIQPSFSLAKKRKNRAEQIKREPPSKKSKTASPQWFG